MTRQFHQIMPLLGLLISLLSLYTAQYNLHFAWKNLVMNCQSHRHLEICRDVLPTIEVPDKLLFLRTEENKRIQTEYIDLTDKEKQCITQS